MRASVIFGDNERFRDQTAARELADNAGVERSPFKYFVRRGCKLQYIEASNWN